MTDPKEGDANWNPVTAGDSTQQQDSTVSNVVGPIPATEPKVIVLHRSALLVQWDRWIACNCPNDETRDWWNSHEGQHFSVVPLEELEEARKSDELQQNVEINIAHGRARSGRPTRDVVIDFERAARRRHARLTLLERLVHFDRSGKGASTPTAPTSEIDYIASVAPSTLPLPQGAGGRQVSETLYKVLGPGRRAYHGGSGVWLAPPKWMPKINKPEPCVRGYHLVTISQLINWLGPQIWIAEGRGETVSDSTKSVWAQARLIRKTAWTSRTARLFAADCAEHVLHLYESKYSNDDRPRKAIEAARHGNAKQRDAAWAAAWDAAGAAARAARDAARDAARAAAWAAAWDAARAAAWAAWDAAGDAAGAAARAAAWDAAGAAAGRRMGRRAGMAGGEAQVLSGGRQVRRDHADSNAAEIIAALEKAGWFVIRVSAAVQQRAGVPDTFVCKRYWHALEIKRLGGHLRASQIAFAMNLKSRGCYHVATGSWEAEKSMEECELRPRALSQQGRDRKLP